MKKRLTERVYVNSYVLRLAGLSNSDTQFSLYLDRPINDVVAVSLDSVTILNLWPSFYKSVGVDFRDFSYVAGGTLYKIQCLLYMTSIAEFVQWLNELSPVVWTL